MAGLLKDIHVAFRRMRRAPLFSWAVMVILGLGIGANTTTLSVAEAFMWRPLDVPNPEQLVTIAINSREGVARNMSLPLIDVLAHAGLPIDSLCAYGGTLAPTDANARPALSPIGLLSGDCFATLGVHSLLGRLITPQDAPIRGKGNAVVVLGYAYWQRMFGGDPNVVGKAVRIDSTMLTVVGVLPRDFRGINKDLNTDLFVPFNSYRANSAASYAVGRLRRETSLAQLESQLGSIWSSALEEALPATVSSAERRAALDVVPELRSAGAGLSTLRNLYGSVFVNLATLMPVLVLLTSINVGGLLCSRLAARTTELAILRALGATRVRIVRAMLAEAALLALGGCVLGLLLAYAAAPAFGTLLPVGNVPWTISLRPDMRVIAAAAGAALVVALVITAIPAWLATRHHTLWIGSDRTMARATNRSAQVLLVLQVAATLVLVFGCGLLVRSLVGLETVNRGYDAEDVLSVRVTQTAGGYVQLNQPLYYRELVTRVSVLPGVNSVGMARYFGTVPDERAWYGPVSWPGREAEVATAIFEYASPGFFKTVGIPLRRGRDFSWSDAPDSTPVVLVSDSLARALEPSGDVVGRFLRYGKEPARQKLQIIGVVGDISFGNSRDRAIRTVYFPGIQVGEGTYGTLHIRTSSRLAPVADRVREILASLGHEQVLAVTTVDGLFTNWLVAERMGAAVSTTVASLAVCIAGIGVYALLANAIARRTRELGIRIAVGATARDVSILVIRDAAILAGVGIALGLPAALVCAKLTESLMFGVATNDPTTLVASAALLMGLAVVAAIVPAWRAARVDPLIALRAE